MLLARTFIADFCLLDAQMQTMHDESAITFNASFMYEISR